MHEIVYKLFFFLMIIIFFTFGFQVKYQLHNFLMYHGLDFVGIDKNFKIVEGPNGKLENTIYVVKKPISCSGDYTTLSCLSSLKSEGGFYNGLFFFSGTNSLK